MSTNTIHHDDIEYMVLTELVQNENFTRSTIPYINEDYFTGNVNRVVFREVKKYFDEYNSLPTKQALSIDLSNSATLFEKEYDAAGELIEYMFDGENAKEKQNEEWVVNRTEEWCKQRAIYNAILESAGIIDPGNKDKKKKPFSAIEGIVRDALSVSFDNSVGHDYFNDSEDRYDFYHRKEERIPFGQESFNEITKGGLPRKTLNIVLAGVHVGKTAFMCDYAANCIRNDNKVLYITMEMAEEKIAERIDANLLDIDIDDIPTMGKALFGKKISDTKLKYKDGRLVIKQFPTGQASVNHFRVLLNELAIKQNFVPDAIVIDYLNICASARYSGDVSNSYGYVKTVAEEIRGLAIEYNIACLTGCQLNRSNFSSSDFEMDGIAESFGISATADFMFGLISTEALEKHGLACVKQLKNRYRDPATKKRFVVSYNKPRMTFTDADDAAQALLSAGSLGVATLPSAGSGSSSPSYPSSPHFHGVSTYSSPKSSTARLSV